jgi:hypothetical protein
MTKIEKTIKDVSDLRDFYIKIKKIKKKEKSDTTCKGKSKEIPGILPGTKN